MISLTLTVLYYKVSGYIKVVTLAPKVYREVHAAELQNP